MSRRNRKLTIASWPFTGGINAYIDLFYGALEKEGIQLVCELKINDEWLRQNASTVDAIHVHWPEDIWRTRGRTWILKLRGVVGLWRFLRLAKSYGCIRVWTLHNLEHHEGTGLIDFIGYSVMARNSDLIIVHNDYTLTAFRKRNRLKGQCIIMPIGNYDGAFPPPLKQRDELLNSLGLSETKKTLLCIGSIRNYKGFDLACTAMQCLPSDYQLIIAGKPHDTEIGNNIKKAASPIKDRAAVILGEVPTQQFADLVNASDAVLLPYRKITGSAVLLTAFSLGKGVIASDLPPLRELLNNNPAAGVLFRTGSAEGLAEGIETYFEMQSEIRNTAARGISELFPWSSVVKPVAQEIRALKR